MKKESRREFIREAINKLILAGVAPSAAGMIVKNYFLIPDRKIDPVAMTYYQPIPVMLPGAENKEEFLSRCIRCFLCGEVCPRSAVRFYGKEEGVRAGIPYILPGAKGCDLCMDCVKVCPTGALCDVEPEKVNMGKARIIENMCLPFIDRGYCGACIVICPVHAIEQGFKLRPKLDEKKCVGCGICEEICPVDGKAIRVTPA
ncbi:MAG: 4Fe-4S dicluster domain-containing protein [Candidatus Schekmanbacteria bacterium]|nr:4Fe-4S dicluster domain-containing protein [Candidatus Schekmanbacteria bacterium]